LKILIVEDNQLLGNSMKHGLSEAGWTTDLAFDGEEGQFLAENSHYDILIIDRMLPKVSGTDLIGALRKKDNHTPVIMVTALGELKDRVSGLEQGADDYLTKPFALAELIARVKALHRRSMGKGSTSLTFNRLSIDHEGRSVAINGIPVELTSKEFDLLLALAGKPNKVFTRVELSDLLYEFDSEPESNSLDVLLARLRKKINGSGVEITTIRGKGFTFRVESPTP